MSSKNDVSDLVLDVVLRRVTDDAQDCESRPYFAAWYSASGTKEHVQAGSAEEREMLVRMHLQPPVNDRDVERLCVTRAELVGLLKEAQKLLP